jgi:hypothetical protein
MTYYGHIPTNKRTQNDMWLMLSHLKMEIKNNNKKPRINGKNDIEKLKLVVIDGLAYL